MRRKRWAFACCSALALVSLAGSAAASSSAPPIAASSRDGGHLTVVTVEPSGSWVGMDPFASNMPATTAALFPIYDALFNVDPSTNTVVTNSLAAGYKVTGGGRVITITLRKNVTFQDGTAFNADAVVWNLERAASPSVNSSCAWDLNVVKSVVATATYEVTIHLASRDAGLIPLLATEPCALMVSPTAYTNEGSNFASNPYGTGPYQYAGGVPGTVANFVRYNGYWGGRPHLNEITIEAVTSEDAALAALQSGSAQAWLGIVDAAAVPDILQARKNPHLDVSGGRAASISYVTFAFTHSPFDNPKARQAVTYATDPKTIDTSLYDNLFRPIQGVFPPSSWAYSGGVEKGYPAYDPKKATNLVNSLGGLGFTLLVADTPSQTQLAETLQAQWQTVGINAEISAVSPSTLQSDLHTLNYEALLTTSPGLPDPDDMVYPWFYSASPYSQNGLRLHAADKEILAGRADYAVGTRKGSYTKLNTLLSSLVPWDDIAATTPYDVVSRKLRGVPVDAYSRFPWATMYFS